MTVANLHQSPRCGFFSTYMGNPITADVQRRKQEIVVRTAGEVWDRVQWVPSRPCARHAEEYSDRNLCRDRRYKVDASCDIDRYRFPWPWTMLIGVADLPVA